MTVNSKELNSNIALSKEEQTELKMWFERTWSNKDAIDASAELGKKQTSRLLDVFKEASWMFSPEVLAMAADITYDAIINMNENVENCTRTTNDINVFTILAEVIVFMRETIRRECHLRAYFVPKEECFPSTPFANMEKLKINRLIKIHDKKIRVDFTKMLKKTMKLMAAPKEINWRDPFTVAAHFQKHGPFLTSLTDFFDFAQAMVKQIEVSTVESKNKAKKQLVTFGKNKIVFNKAGTDYIKTVFNQDNHEYGHVCKKCQIEIEHLELQATMRCLNVVLFLENCRKNNIEPCLTSFVFRFPGEIYDFTECSFAKLMYKWRQLVKERCCEQILEKFKEYDARVKEHLNATLKNDPQAQMFGRVIYKSLPFVQFGPYVLFICKDSPPNIADVEGKSMKCKFVDKKKKSASVETVEFLSRTFASNYVQIYVPLEDVLKDQAIGSDPKSYEELLLYGVETMVWTISSRTEFKTTMNSLLVKWNKEATTATNQFVSWIREILTEEDQVLSEIENLDFDEPMEVDNQENDGNEENGRSAKRPRLSAQLEQVQEASEACHTGLHDSFMKTAPHAPAKARAIQREAESRTLLMVAKFGRFIKDPSDSEKSGNQRNCDVELQFDENRYETEKERTMIKELSKLYVWNPPKQKGDCKGGNYKRWLDPWEKNQAPLKAHIEFNGVELALILSRSRKNIALNVRLLPNRTAFCICAKCKLVDPLPASSDICTEYCCREVLESTEGRSSHVKNFRSRFITSEPDQISSGCITESLIFQRKLEELIKSRNEDLNDLKKSAQNMVYVLGCQLCNIYLFKSEGCVSCHKDEHLPSCVIAYLHDKLTVNSVSDEDDDDEDPSQPEQIIPQTAGPKQYKVKYTSTEKPEEVQFFETIWHPRRDECSSVRYTLADALRSSLQQRDLQRLNLSENQVALLSSIPKKCDVNVFLHVTYSSSFRMYAWKAFVKESPQNNNQNESQTVWDRITESPETSSPQSRRNKKKKNSRHAVFLKRDADGTYRIVTWSRSAAATTDVEPMEIGA